MSMKRNVLIAAATTAVVICSLLSVHAGVDPWAALHHSGVGFAIATAGAAAAALPTTLKALQEKRAGIVDQMTALIQKAETEDRDLTDDERTQFDELKGQRDALDGRIERASDVSSAQARLAEIRPAIARSQGLARPGGPEAKKEFESLGEFMHAVRFNPNDQRLGTLFVEGVGAAEELGAASDMRMDTGATGGFAIPPQFRQDLFMKVAPQDALVRPRAMVLPAGDPPDAPLTFPALDQSGTGPANMYGGVQVQWIAEGALKPQTDAALTDVTLEPHEVAGHVVVTDKLLRNWQAADPMLRGLLRGAVLGAEDTAFLRGDGVGKPLGIIPANATYRVNRQTANQFSYIDAVNMVARVLMRGGTPIWSLSQALVPQLATFKDPVGNYIWKPIGTDDANAALGFAGTLLGYPVRWNNRSPLLGSLGDVTLADWSYYIIKDGSGPFIASSEHVYFLNNKTVIKIFWNVDGAPWLQAPFMEENGYQVSPFVALDIPAG